MDDDERDLETQWINSRLSELERQDQENVSGCAQFAAIGWLAAIIGLAVLLSYVVRW